MKGYDFNQPISLLVRNFIELLRNAELPVLEVQQALSTLTGRISAKLESNISEILLNYKSEDSALERIQNFINEAVESCISIEEKQGIISSVLPIQDVLNVYSGGSKYYESRILIEVIEKYWNVEKLFDNNRYEDVLRSLREQGVATESIISTARAYKNPTNRAEVVLSILDQVRSASFGNSQTQKNDFRTAVQKLADLNSPQSAKISLKAREFLIFFQMPSFDERYNATLQVLSSAVRPSSTIDSTPNFNYDQVLQLITSNLPIVDVLPSFFYHENLGIRSIAMYTYVLHTAQAFTITSVKHLFAVTPNIFEWEYAYRNSNQHSNPNTPVTKRKSSESDNMPITPPSSECSGHMLDSDIKLPRKGIMCAFEDLKVLEEKLGLVIKTGAGSVSPSSLVRVLKVALKLSKDDETLPNDTAASEYLQSLVDKSSDLLKQFGYKRITFMVFRDGQFPMYFTFRILHDFKEDQVIRHIEPAMAFQLELQRLGNFKISPCFVENRRIHIYHALSKKNPSESRYFVRALVYPGQVVSPLRPSEFLVSEGNRIIGDVLDNLEVVWGVHPNTDCNHLFLNFIPVFELDLGTFEACIKELIDRHGKRFWKLRITSAEIRFIMRQAPNQAAKPIRFFVTSLNGYVTRVEIYHENRDSSGSNKLMSITSPPGSLHKQSVNILYPTKESIQLKRYKAHLLGTTFVYDFPDLFRGAVEQKWIKYQNDNFAKIPTTIMNCIELVLNNNGEFVEELREPGLNNCGMIVWLMEMFTPEYPEGRSVIVIANDITFQIGSFGPQESLVFSKASEYARKKG